MNIFKLQKFIINKVDRKRKWDQADNVEEAPDTKVAKTENDPSKAVSKFNYKLSIFKNISD